MVHSSFFQASYIVFPADIFQGCLMWLFIPLLRALSSSPQSRFKNSDVVELTLVKKYCPFKSLSQSANTFVLVNMPVRIFTVA